MTATLEPTEARPWTMAPGWGIAANLLPPEVIKARRMRKARKVLFIVAAAAVAVVLLGYAAATFTAFQAQGRLDDAQTETTQLQHQQRRFADVVDVKAATTRLTGQSKALTTQAVDFPPLLAALRGALPDGVNINQLVVTLDSSKSQGSGTGNAGGAGVLDTSGRKHIGSVTISGSARRLSDVSAYVDRLAKVPGVVEPYPTSSNAGDGVVTYSLQLTLTDQLLPTPTPSSSAPSNGSQK
ncbi:hypothetical protein [Oryzihumus sp.]|uniref:PilN domain-containing protein n=1 Tax=Oryzihumus sp. TaxID=1968903 RepID=UPI002ED995F0